VDTSKVDEALEVTELAESDVYQIEESRIPPTAKTVDFLLAPL
jgi:translation initiation factor IF-3